MSNSMSDHGHQVNGNDDGDNTEYKAHRPGAMRRTIAKIKNTTGLAHDTKAAYVNYQDDKPHPHPKIEDLVNTIGFSLIQELMQYLKGHDGEAAMEAIFNTQARVAARLALTDEARQAARTTAQEAVTGSYDGTLQMSQELLTKMPPYVLTAGALVLGSFMTLLAIGLLGSLWRFALFGLQ